MMPELVVARREERDFLRPTQMKSRPNTTLVDAEVLAQFRQTRRHTSHSKHKIVPLVSPLLLVGCPPAIAWLIVSMLIWPTVDFQSWRAFSHVGKEVLERQSPPSAHCNAAPAIRWESGVVRILASLDHIGPCLISSSSTLLVRCFCFRSPFFLKTPAGLRMSRAKTFVPSDKNISTIALDPTSSTALPVRASVRFCGTKYDSSSKTDSNGARFKRHNVRLSLSNVVASGGHPASTGARCGIIAIA